MAEKEEGAKGERRYLCAAEKSERCLLSRLLKAWSEQKKKEKKKGGPNWFLLLRQRKRGRKSSIIYAKKRGEREEWKEGFRLL